MPRRGKQAVTALVAPATRLALCSANSPFSMVARPLGFQNTASPLPSRVTALCPIPTARAPTGNKRNSPPAFCAPSAAMAWAPRWTGGPARSEEHTSELQSHSDLVCRLLLEKKKKKGKPAASERGGKSHACERAKPSILNSL